MMLSTQATSLVTLCLALSLNIKSNNLETGNY